MSTIPASLFVNVVPSVLGVGGAAIDVIGLALTSGNRVPIGSVYSFSSGATVTSFFGTGSAEDIFANGASGKGSGYFGGFTGEQASPGRVLFAQYNPVAVAAYLWGGNASVLTLAQLQALSGSLTVAIDGYSHVISSISLATYNSFSAAATAIQNAFTEPTESTFTASIGASFTGSQTGTNLTTTSTSGLISVGDVIAGVGVAGGTTILSQTSGTTGGDGVYVTSVSGTASTASCTASSTVLNVTADTDHAVAAGQTLAGASVAAGTLITTQLGGTTGGIGTYRLSGAPQQIPSEAMTGVATTPVVTFDSLSGAFVIKSGVTGVPSAAAFATGTLAAPLFLTQATGAVLSQGAAAATPAGTLNSVYNVTQDWVTYTTLFDPDNGSGNTIKQAFAAWKNSRPSRFAYICEDPDVLARSQAPQTSTLGSILGGNGDSGTCLISELSPLNYAAFIMGTAAAIDFQRTNGRTDFAFRSQAGLVADVTTEAAAVNLGGNPQVIGDFGNGYNYYGAVGAANAGFTWFQRGTVTGPFTWFDSYINQIQLNSSFQVALLNLQANSLNIPFSQVGANLIEASMADPIQAGLNFGTFAPGDISSAQIVAVNQAAGADISASLQAQGYYLQVNQQPSTVRANRGPWQITFWYLDRGSVQAISVSSVALQ